MQYCLLMHYQEAARSAEEEDMAPARAAFAKYPTTWTRRAC